MHDETYYDDCKIELVLVCNIDDFQCDECLFV